jgi:hypothetical protein
MIIVFSIFSSSIIHAQGNILFRQYPYFYGQYGQQWGIQAYTPGYFSSFNQIGQYVKQWGVQPYITGNFGSYNSIPQPWSSQPHLSSESPSNLNLIYSLLFLLLETFPITFLIHHTQWFWLSINGKLGILEIFIVEYAREI